MMCCDAAGENFFEFKFSLKFVLSMHLDNFISMHLDLYVILERSRGSTFRF